MCVHHTVVKDKDIMLEKDCLCGKADVVPFSIPIINETVCTVSWN